MVSIQPFLGKFIACGKMKKKTAQTNGFQLQKINVESSLTPQLLAYMLKLLKDLVTLNNSGVVKNKSVTMGVYKLGKQGKLNCVR